MDLHPTDAQRFNALEQELGSRDVAPAVYEMIRRMVSVTGDFGYGSRLNCPEEALRSGAAALAARNTVIVDIPAVQVALMPVFQASFANPIYCCQEAIMRPQREKTRTAWGLETLAQRYPNGIFVIGQEVSALASLVRLIQQQSLHPALVIATPPLLAPDLDWIKQLHQSNCPVISLSDRPGNAMVAVALLTALVEMTWEAYGPTPLANQAG